MASVPSELGSYSTRRLLIWRVRIVMLICVAGGIIFGGKEFLLQGHATTQVWVQVVGTSLAISTFWVMRQHWVLPWAWPISVFVVSVAYVMTGIAGIVSPTHEYTTTAVLFVGAAMTTATIVPWGMWAQLITVLIGAATFAAAVVVANGTLWALIMDPPAATMIAFVWSIMTAYEVNRYRFGHRRELLLRRRGEFAIKRLNTGLEERVAERTAQLKSANETLAREATERIESQQRFADTVDHSNAIISLKDPTGRYLLVNREFENVFGVARDDTIGRTDVHLFGTELAAQLGARDEEVLRTGKAVSFEQELCVGDAPRSFVAVKFPLRATAGSPYGVGTVATDIGRLKQLQDELRRHQDELAHVLRLHTITEMAAGLAHEINQPLCAITNYAQGGMQRLRGDDPNGRGLFEVFQRITEEGLRAGQIIRGIRNLVQRSNAASESIDVYSLASEALRLLEARARQYGVIVRLQPARRVPTVRADATQIEQVILNLVLNGIEAIDGAEGSREVIVSIKAYGGGVEVSVHDTGRGMAADAAEKLFTPFFTTKREGLGLGLAISRSIVELHGGRLWATRNPGSGMTFCFWLPEVADAVTAVPDSTDVPTRAEH